ncbi:MAG: hypothetical protein AAF849_22765 [Bacteroidota bacterium]
MKKIKTKEAIEMADKGLSLKGIILEDIQDMQVNVRDALTLSRSGVVVPEANIYYDDADIAYDVDIDEVDWSEEYVDLSWEEKEQLFEKEKASFNETVHIPIAVRDAKLKLWLESNEVKLSKLLYPILTSLYQAEQSMIEK